MHAQVVFDRSQKPRRLVTCRRDDGARAMRQGACHQHAPGVLISWLCSVLQQERVAHRLNRPQAKPTGKGFILRHGAILRRHALRQAWRLLMGVYHHGCFNLVIDLLLCPKGGANEPMQPRHLQKEADEPNPTRTNLDKHHLERQDQSMEEGKTRNAQRRKVAHEQAIL